MNLKDFLKRNCLGNRAFSRDYLAMPYGISYRDRSYVISSTGYLMIAISMPIDGFHYLSNHPFGRIIDNATSNLTSIKFSSLREWAGDPAWPDFSCANCQKFIPCPQCTASDHPIEEECKICDGEGEISCPHCELTVPIEETRVGKINGTLYNRIHLARMTDYFQDDIVTISTGISVHPYVRIDGKNWKAILTCLDKAYHPENAKKPFPNLF